MARIAWRHCTRGYDLIHVQTVPDILVFAAVVPRLLRTPVVLDLRDLTPELFASRFHLREDSSLMRFLLLGEKAAATFATHVIVANPIWIERVATRSAPRSKCTMIWYHPDPDLFALTPRSRSDDRFVVYYPGSLNWHQGVDIALRALARLRELIPTVELWIQGEGPEKQNLLTLAGELNLGSSVRWFPPVPVSHIAAIMSQADVAVVPKRSSCNFGNEAASTKISEFMAVGVPVVASRTRIEMLLFDDSTIRFYDGDDEAALASALLELWHDPALAKRLRANGSAFIRGCARERTVSAYLQLVDNATGTTPAAANAMTAKTDRPI